MLLNAISQQKYRLLVQRLSLSRYRVMMVPAIANAAAVGRQKINRHLQGNVKQKHSTSTCQMLPLMVCFSSQTRQFRAAIIWKSLQSLGIRSVTHAWFLFNQPRLGYSGLHQYWPKSKLAEPENSEECKLVPTMTFDLWPQIKWLTRTCDVLSTCQVYVQWFFQCADIHVHRERINILLPWLRRLITITVTQPTVKALKDDSALMLLTWCDDTCNGGIRCGSVHNNVDSELNAMNQTI